MKAKTLKPSFSLIIIPALFLLTTACAGPEAKGKPVVEFLNPPGSEANDLPFSEAVRVGHTLYLSGQIGVVPGTMELAAGGIQAETRQTMENIRNTLQRYGADMDDVVKCTVFLADIGEWPRMNAVYTTFFDRPYPARSAVAGSGLALGARVEIECIAVVD